MPEEEKNLILTTEYRSLEELMDVEDYRKISKDRTYDQFNFCILNNDDNNTMLIKSSVKHLKGYPIFPKGQIAFVKKDPREVFLAAAEGEVEIRILFI
jgi:hypothetical protein